MRSNNGPSKEQVREWLVCRYLHRTPLPEFAELRRQLGWKDSLTLASGEDEGINGDTVSNTNTAAIAFFSDCIRLY